MFKFGGVFLAHPVKDDYFLPINLEILSGPEFHGKLVVDLNNKVNAGMALLINLN